MQHCLHCADPRSSGLNVPSLWVVAEQEIDASIADYLWFPTDQKPLQQLMKDWVGGKDFYDINAYVIGPFFAFVLGAVGVVIGGIIKRRSLVAPIMGAVAGFWMTWTYLTQPVYKYGLNYGLHVAVAIALLVVSVATLALYIAEKIMITRERNKKYKQYRQ